MHALPGSGPLTVVQPVGGDTVVVTGGGGGGGGAVVVTGGGGGVGVVGLGGFVVGFPQLEEQKPQLPWPPTWSPFESVRVEHHGSVSP